jgi:hypothetical protein
VKITCPGPSPYGCQLRPDAVRAAVAELGIEGDVAIEWFGLEVRPGIHAVHEGNRDGSHEIYLSVWDRPARVSRSLWHELEHARQNEALGIDTYNAVQRLGEEFDGYEGNPLEVEANDVADAHRHVQLTDGSTFDATVPDAAWRSLRELEAAGMV